MARALRWTVLALSIPIVLGALGEIPGARAQSTDSQTIQTHDVPSDHIQPSMITEVQGTVLTVTVDNPSNSTHSHNVFISGYNAPAPQSQMQDWGLQPGSTKSFTVTLDQAGTFPYFSTWPGDQAGGIAGTLVVQASSNGGSGSSGGSKTPGPEPAAVLAVIGIAALLWTGRRPS
jgi:uncharacterized cupredoxin-like copper-binding protein